MCFVFYVFLVWIDYGPVSILHFLVSVSIAYEWMTHRWSAAMFFSGTQLIGCELKILNQSIVCVHLTVEKWIFLGIQLRSGIVKYLCNFAGFNIFGDSEQNV